MAVPVDILNKDPALDEWAILSGWRGSIAHGMYTPKQDPDSIDDKDVMTVCVPPIDYYLGLKQYGSRGTSELKHGEWDIVVYELKKFILLLAKGNPNVISLLWLEPTHYLKRTERGDLLIENKELFHSLKIYHSFVGYAHDQLYKMTHLACKGYMGEKRKRLVEKFGYDTKNAAHLIRLMRMCIEFLKERRFIIQRPDNQNLLEIKRGCWSLDQVKAESEILFRRAEAAYDNCTLPADPDMKKINDLCVAILEME